MFFNSQLKVDLSKDIPLVPGNVIPEEAMVLVRELIDGKEHVRVSSDTVAPFAGVSYAGENRTPIYLSKVETCTVDASKKITLSRTPMTGQYRVIKVADGTALTVSGADGNVLTTTDGVEDDIVEVTFRYSPTSEELIMNNRMMMYPMSASDLTSKIGVIMKGEFYTNYFDATANFADTTKVLGVASGGIFTMLASSETTKIVPRAEIIHVPSQDTPYLGIRLL